MNVLNRNTFRGKALRAFSLTELLVVLVIIGNSGAGSDAEPDAVDLKGEGDGGPAAAYIPTFVGEELFLHLFTIFR